MPENEPDASREQPGDGYDTARRVSALIRHSPGLIAVLDADAELAYLSPAACRLITGADNTPLGPGARHDFHIHESDYAALRDAFDPCIAAGNRASVPVRFRARPGDGPWRNVEGHCENFLDDPDVAGIVYYLADVTERDAAETELRHRFDVEATMSRISRDFIDRDVAMLDSCIDDALAAVGELAGADRCFVLSLDSGKFDNTHEWSRDPSMTRRELIRGISIEAFPWGLELVRRYTPLVVNRLDDVPPEGAAERALLEGLGVCSLVIAPMIERGELVGFVGVDTLERETAWPPSIVGMLVQLASVLTAALGRRDAEEARHRADAELRSSEERFRRLVQHSADLIIVTDASGHVTYASPAAERMLGFTPEEASEVNIFDLVHPDDLREAADEFTGIMDRGGDAGEPTLLRARRSDGTWLHVEVVGADLVDDAAVGGIVLNIRDVSERVPIEAAMREGESRLELAFDNAAIGMALGTPQGRFVRVNAALCDLLGMSTDDLCRIGFADLTHPDDLAKNLDLHERLFAGELRTYQMEKRFRHAEGHWVWTRVSVSLLRDEDGRPIYSVDQVEDVTERKRIQDRLAYEATHDTLTGLPLRKLLLDRLELALAGSRRRGTVVAALFVDLDNFKRVNDSLGHAAGDELLIMVGDRIRTAVREVDTPGRFGGDEFVVICPDLGDALDAVAVAERIRTQVERPFVVRGIEVFVAASVGIAISEPETDAATLLRRADTAVYRAKDRGRNRFEIFDDELRATVAHRLDTEVALRRGLEFGELRLVYQPVVELPSGVVRGFEGLVRWARPGHGLVSPAGFLGIAEETGLIVPLGRQVLEIACEELAGWSNEPPGGRVPALSVNLSARQLAQPGLVDEVRGVIANSGAPADKVTLEITETLLMHDTPQTIRTLHDLRDLGVALAIDDFGTGYSSLSYLRRLPVTVLKLDRSFVRELDSDREGSTIVAAVVDLAHALGLEIVAEGAETVGHVEELIALGCDLVQGFHLSPPVPPQVATDLFVSGIDPIAGGTPT